MADQDFSYPELFGDLKKAEDEKWFVVYTKPRREKKLAEYAYKNKITYFLPLVNSYRIFERKKVVYTKPMFSSYIFVRVSHIKRQELIVSGHTVSFIFAKDEVGFLKELSYIYKLREKKIEARVHTYLEKGKYVRFTKGALKGVVGKVADAKNIKEVILQVNILKQAVAVQAQSSDLELLSDSEVSSLELDFV